MSLSGCGVQCHSMNGLLSSLLNTLRLIPFSSNDERECMKEGAVWMGSGLALKMSMSLKGLLH